MYMALFAWFGYEQSIMNAGKYGSIFKSEIIEHMLWFNLIRSSWEVALRRVTQEKFDDGRLVQMLSLCP